MVKKKLKVPMLFKLRPDLAKFIRAESEKQGKTITRIVEEALMKKAGMIQ